MTTYYLLNDPDWLFDEEDGRFDYRSYNKATVWQVGDGTWFGSGGRRYILFQDGSWDSDEFYEALGRISEIHPGLFTSFDDLDDEQKQELEETGEIPDYTEITDAQLFILSHEIAVKEYDVKPGSWLVRLAKKIVENGGEPVEVPRG